MKRKSPVRHRVKSHTREGKRVNSFSRGHGTKQILKNKTKKVKLRSGKQRILDSHKYPASDKLYHITNRLQEVLKNNELKGSKLWGSVSLTADSKIAKIIPDYGRRKHRIILDMKKLKRDYPTLVPKYYSFSSGMPDDVRRFYEKQGYKNPDKLPHFNTLMTSSNFSHESEWVLDRSVKNLDKYIIKIEEI